MNISKKYPTSQQLAPKVLNLLIKSGREENHALLAELEELLSGGNTTEHSALKREQGVSFNPLPARVLEIAHRECGISDYALLSSCLKRCKTQELGIVTRVEQTTAEIIAEGMFQLDVARHLHRLDTPDDKKVSIVKMLENFTKEHQNIIPQRLLTLLEAANARALCKYCIDGASI